MEISLDTLMIIMWSAYTLLMLGIIVAIIFWAKMSQQFREQAHAARLPLEIADSIIKIDD